METKFQTSFIPKKPIGSPIGNSVPAPVKHTSSIFMSIATMIFILSILGTGGVFAYKYYLENDQVALKTDLATREKQFNTDLIEQLKNQNVKIDTARSLLNSHLALSQIFDILGRLTIQNVRFLSLDLTSPTSDSKNSNSNGINISLQGYGTSLSAVAFQSDVLSQLDQYGLRKVVKNPIISNPTIGTNGAVSFGFTAVVDPGSLSYESFVAPASSDTSGSPSSGSNADNSASSSANTDQINTSVTNTGTAGSNSSPNPFNSQ